MGNMLIGFNDFRHSYKLYNYIKIAKFKQACWWFYKQHPDFYSLQNTALILEVAIFSYSKLK